MRNPQATKTGGAVANEDSGTVPTSENWKTEEESVVGGADDVQTVSVTINQ